MAFNHTTRPFGDGVKVGEGCEGPVPSVVSPAAPTITIPPPVVHAGSILSSERDLEAGSPSSTSPSPPFAAPIASPANDAISQAPGIQLQLTDPTFPVGSRSPIKAGRQKHTPSILRRPWQHVRSWFNGSKTSSPTPSVNILDRIEMQNQVAPELFARAPLRHSRQAHLLRADRNRGGLGGSTLVHGDVLPSPVPAYTEQFVPDDGDKTVPEYFWIYGFLFPPFWILGALYLRAGLHMKWNPGLEEIDPRHRDEAKRVFRAREKKYARRCLGCLIVVLLISSALVEGSIFGLR